MPGDKNPFGSAPTRPSSKGEVCGTENGVHMSALLHEAIVGDNAIEVRNLLEAGADPNCVDRRTRKAPLCVAVETRAGFEIVECLVKHGANVSDRRGEYLPHVLAETRRQERAAAFLKEKFLEKLTVAERNSFELYAAARAGDLAKVRLALKAGGVIDYLEWSGNERRRSSPLSVAVLRGHSEVAEFLLENDPRVNFPIPGVAPGRLIEYRMDGECNVAHWWACRDDIEVLRFLADRKVDLNQQDSAGSTPFYVAAQYSSIKAAKFLLKSGADPKTRNALQCSAEAFAQSLEIRGRLKPVSKEEKRLVRSFLERDITKKEFAKLESSEALHLFASEFNWDNDIRAMHWVVESKLCDKATAMMVYWLASPAHQCATNDECSEASGLIRKIEENVGNGFYRNQNIYYDPCSTHIDRVLSEHVFDDRLVRERIPEFMLAPQIGQIWKIG